MRTVAPILYNPALLILFFTFGHFLPVISIFSTFGNFSGTFCKRKISCVTCHKSHVSCYISHDTCHLPPVNNANSHRPSPSDSPNIHNTLAQDPKTVINQESTLKHQISLLLLMIHSFWKGAKLQSCFVLHKCCFRRYAPKYARFL